MTVDTPLTVVLHDLAGLVGRVGPDQAGRPTPCPAYDVAALREHVLGWLPVFAAALADPDGTAPRPDPAAYRAPADPTAAAAAVADATKQIEAALADGVADRPVTFLGGTPLPGAGVVGMLTGEVVAHGWDLARATGQAWTPSPAACETALAALGGMLTAEYRGEGMGFGAEVAVPDDASALDRLLGFSGRDPNWQPAG